MDKNIRLLKLLHEWVEKWSNCGYIKLIWNPVLKYFLIWTVHKIKIPKAQKRQINSFFNSASKNWNSRLFTWTELFLLSSLKEENVLKLRANRKTAGKVILEFSKEMWKLCKKTLNGQYNVDFSLLSSIRCASETYLLMLWFLNVITYL